MFERDYLVRMLVELAAAIKRAMQKAREENDLESASATLESSISDATDLDGSVLLSLSPESIAQVFKVSAIDPRLVVYIAHSMQLQSHYLDKLGDNELSVLRLEQATSLAKAYNFELPSNLDDIDIDTFCDDDYFDSIKQLTGEKENKFNL